MTGVLAGVRSVTQIPIREHPSMLLFEVERGPRGTAIVVWERRDRFAGEDAHAIELAGPRNGRRHKRSTRSEKNRK
jgi:hypothetical protein